MSSSDLSMWVGRNCVMGISLSASALRSGASMPAPGPMWQYMRPHLLESIPPTRHSQASLMISCVVGWDPRWSEIAISPTPITCSRRQRSRRTVPVTVGGGHWYDPVHIRAVIPSSLNARTLVTRFSSDRETSSVPRTPTTVVNPPRMSCFKVASGVREVGPISPPPPVTCTCMSTMPGNMTMPLPSITVVPGMSLNCCSIRSAGASSRRPMILPPPIRTCLPMSGDGVYMQSTFLISVSCVREPGSVAGMRESAGGAVSLGLKQRLHFS
mmetsp:Transcript_9746/g.22352  ORF Transcript_9746/g.22352 Transcript_9746/m.22352 type:complete len:270 (-) Transcript_9746:3012-3821(-)